MEGFLHPFDEADNLFLFDEATIGGGGIDPDEYLFTDWQRVKWKKPEQKRKAKKIVASIKKARDDGLIDRLAKLNADLAALMWQVEEDQRREAEMLRKRRNMQAIQRFLEMV